MKIFYQVVFFSLNSTHEYLSNFTVLDTLTPLLVRIFFDGGVKVFGGEGSLGSKSFGRPLDSVFPPIFLRIFPPAAGQNTIKIIGGGMVGSIIPPRKKYTLASPLPNSNQSFRMTLDQSS